MAQSGETPRLAVIFSLAMVILILGATVYHFLEGLRWLDAFYLATITLATVGYGDFAPRTDAGKVFTMVYILFGLGLFAALIDALAQRRRSFLEKRHERQDP